MAFQGGEDPAPHYLNAESGLVTVAGVDIRLVAMGLTHRAAQVVRYPAKAGEAAACEPSQSGNCCDPVASAKV